MSVTLNGHVYDISQFVGYGYLNTNADTGLIQFPNSIFSDMLATLAASAAILGGGLNPSTAGNIPVSDGSVWRRSQDGNYPVILFGNLSINKSAATLTLGSASNTLAEIRFENVAATTIWRIGRGILSGSNNNLLLYDQVNSVTAFSVAPGATNAVVFNGGVTGITSLAIGGALSGVTTAEISGLATFTPGSGVRGFKMAGGGIASWYDATATEVARIVANQTGTGTSTAFVVLQTTGQSFEVMGGGAHSQLVIMGSGTVFAANAVDGNPILTLTDTAKAARFFGTLAVDGISSLTGGIQADMGATIRGLRITSTDATAYSASTNVTATGVQLFLGKTAAPSANAYASIGFGSSALSQYAEYGVVYDATPLASFFWKTYNGVAWAERMRLSSGGELTVNGTATVVSTVNSSGGSTYLQWQNAGATKGYLGWNGTNMVALNAAGNAYLLQWTNAGAVAMPAYGAGAATFDASGNITSVSDERHKRNIRRYVSGLREIRMLQTIIYGFNELSGLDQFHEYTGFGASNVQRAMPENVFVHPVTGVKSVWDRGISAASVNAIQELATTQDIHQLRLDSHEIRITRLEKAA